MNDFIKKHIINLDVRQHPSSPPHHALTYVRKQGQVRLSKAFTGRKRDSDAALNSIWLNIIWRKHTLGCFNPLLFSLRLASPPLAEKVIRDTIHGLDTQTPFVEALWVSEWSEWKERCVQSIRKRDDGERQDNSGLASVTFLYLLFFECLLYGFSLDVCVCAYSPRAAQRRMRFDIWIMKETRVD